MDSCALLPIVGAIVVMTEVALMLNIHRVVKEPEQQNVLPGGEVKPGLSRVQILRFAIGSSIVMLVVIFAFVMNTQGCFA
ncbi:MAG: hypothetical protein KIT83_03925 [Bryobacterales bacterium]|jgi:hypothetical protein|nr:hypothetical protein [Bryobacterales bacterium]